ncbi:ATP-dependent RNA helicase dbp10, partial [Dispira parvispora]
AGLHEPELVRLDVDTKISSDLEMAFFQVKPLEKEGALLYLLRNVIQLPTMTSEERVLEARRVALLREQTKVARESRRRNKKGKGKPGSREDSNDQDDDLDDQELEEANPANHVGTDQQTIIFVATKHHVEYLSQLLIEAGFKVSYIYGSLDQTARKIQTHNFRMGYSHIMVVTDVAARGIDIPILQNVVNYHFVDSSKTFIHRVGRVARAGRRGWAYSLVTNEELPHVLDLQLFLGRQLVVGKTTKPVHQIDYTKDIVLGRLPHELFDTDLEWVQGQLQVIVTLYDNHRMSTNGLKLFNKTKRVASSESYKRTKDLLLDPDLQEAAHPLIAAQIDDAEKKRLAMVHAISNFRPSETIFEVGQRGTKHISAATEVMRKRRVTSTKYIEEVRQKQAERESLYQEKLASGVYDSDGESDNESPAAVLTSDAETADPSSSVQVLDGGQSGKYRDEGYYISYYQKDANTERGYAVNKGMTFAEQAQSAVFGIQGDENVDLIKQKNALRWDKKKKQFTRGFGVGADNKKMIRSESGALLPASYASGSFTEWQNKTHIQIPRTGEAELSNFRGMPARRRFPHASAGQSGKKGNGAGKGKGKGKGDLKTTDQIVKQRRLESKRKERMTQRTNNKRKKTK